MVHKSLGWQLLPIYRCIVLDWLQSTFYLIAISQLALHAPNSENVGWAFIYSFSLFVHACVRSLAHNRFCVRMMYARVLKLYIWVPDGKFTELFFPPVYDYGFMTLFQKFKHNLCLS